MQHTPWLYGFSNTPGRIRERLDGLEGFRDETDANAAAWRLFRTLGFYPVLPSDGEYMLAPPGVSEVRLQVQGQPLHLEAPGAESGGWPGSVTIDGQPQPGRLMNHQRLLRGGVVRFDGSPGDERARSAGK